MLPENHSVSESTPEPQEVTQTPTELSLGELADLYRIDDTPNIKNAALTAGVGDLFPVDVEEREAWEKMRDLYRENRLKELELLRVSSPELTQVIEGIDFSKLKNLFTERLERVDPYDRKYLVANMPFATSDRIIPVASQSIQTSAAQAHIDAMVVTVVKLPEAINVMPASESESVELKKLRDLQYFHTIVHEEAHIVSTEVPAEVYKTGRLSSYKTGFESGFGHPTVSTVVRRSFNEGVTEKIAQEISLEYLKRYGFKDYSVDDISTVTRGVYERERLLVEAMIEIISNDTDVPQEVVWGAINESYFTNRNNAFTSELKEVFEKISGDDFWQRFLSLSGQGHSVLSTASVHDELNRFVKSEKLSQGLSDKIKKHLIPTPPPLPVETSQVTEE